MQENAYVFGIKNFEIERWTRFVSLFVEQDILSVSLLLPLDFLFL